jgi:hypothetical protein
VRRRAAVGILAVVILAAVAGVALAVAGGGDNGPGSGCTGVRAAYRAVSRIETANAVPTSDDYSRAALVVRRAAADATATVQAPLAALADAYGRLGGLLDGFDPADASTYYVVEDSAAAVDLQQATVDAELPAVRKWLDERCV